ncbi:hypothetical protein [Amycolatopsis taiwanensis]|uniref:hypothetical protein n=1 Tax=Amycolatopsis taiwanensis TaxID=342230 RepID=UPI0012EBFBA0|nr:hypothetical protein [Amycolatopsis taiwanensis]
MSLELLRPPASLPLFPLPTQRFPRVAGEGRRPPVGLGMTDGGVDLEAKPIDRGQQRGVLLPGIGIGVWVKEQQRSRSAR